MPDPNNLFQPALNQIEEEIRNINFPTHPQNLYEPIQYMMQLGGKRIRPLLTLLCAEACGLPEKHILSCSIGFEMFHNFTLMHDDLMDGANIRRGKPTIHQNWNNSIAILSGDAMFVKSVEMISSITSEKKNEIVSLFLSTAMQVCEGQQLDMDFESREDISIEDYLQMIELKTAVLLGACCKAGALAANVDDETADLFYNIGRNMGIAFQLQDDFLDSLGNEEMFGKKIGGDITTGKKTILYLATLKNLPDSEKLSFIDSMNQSGEGKKIESVIQYYHKAGAPKVCQDMMESFLKKARTSISILSSTKQMDKIGSLLEYLAHRKV